MRIFSELNSNHMKGGVQFNHNLLNRFKKVAYRPSYLYLYFQKKDTFFAIINKTSMEYSKRGQSDHYYCEDL